VTLAIVLVFLGLLFLVAEIFFTSFGLFGILSAAGLIGGIVVAFEESRGAGIALLVVTLFLAPAVFGGALKVFPRTPFGRHLILPAGDRESKSAAPASLDGIVKPGDEGVAISMLRPAGIAEIRGRRVDVVTDGAMLAPGTRVRVQNTSGNRVVVEAAGDGGAAG